MTPYRLPVYLACTLLALIINYALGKDMAADTLSYHLYAGFSAVHDRFAQDYFPAGPQSYFNPYIYVPFYYLVSFGLSSLEISSALAIVHSVMLWLTYELALTACPYEDRRRRLIFGLCAVVFALINPILLQQIGSPFADITTGELVLAGWLLVALAVRAPSTARIIGGGLLCGLATGLKLTNAVHAISAFALLVLLPLTFWARIRSCLVYAISLAVGFVVVAAPWSFRLESRFGNPLFPLMNNVFRSPEFTTETSRAFRFLPATVSEALWRPFAMINPVAMVHEELRAPDPRYALLLMLLGAFVCRWLWRRRGRFWSRPAMEESSLRTLVALGCGLAVDWSAWLSASGNSRYFLPISSVAAVVLAALLFRLFATQPALRNGILAAILAAQGLQLGMGTSYRWNSAPWEDRWADITIPAELASEPNLFLTMGTPTNSFLAPYLPPGAGLVNFIGLYTLSPDGSNGAHLRALIQRYAPNVRMLIRGERVYGDDERRMPSRTQIDDALGPFGLRVDASDCARIAVKGLPPDLDSTWERSRATVRQPADTTYLVSCRVVPDEADHSALKLARRDVDLALDHLEDACPALFQPRRPRTEYSGSGGLRRYGGTDLTAWVSYGSVKFIHAIVGGDLVYLGREDDWAKAPVPVRCGRRNGRYFAGLVQSTEQRQPTPKP